MLSTCVAVYTVCWQIFARSRPGPRPSTLDSGSTPAAEPEPAPSMEPQQVEEKGEEEKNESGKAVEWKIFRLRSCQSMVCYWIACGNIYMNMAQWAPTVSPDACGMLLPAYLPILLSAHHMAS